jgi:murein DD-endopeptidase MepM/ murein hydrolase activator NlpD
MKKITKILLFSLSISFYTLPGFSQQKPVEITIKRNDDKTVDFYYKKTSPGSTHIIIKFKKLENAKSNLVIKKNIKGFSGNLLKLEPFDDKKNINFSYSYSYMLGNSKAKVENQFKYLLPFKSGKEVEAIDLNYLGNKYGNTEPKNWKAIQFLTNPNDTIYASRKGVVVETKNEFSEDNSTEYSYKKGANHIIIEHEDGTLAKYGVLKRNSLMVKLGDKVYPSIPIAIAGTYDKPENSQLRFEVYFLDNEIIASRKIGEKQTLANQKHYYAFVNPFFHTKSNTTQLHSGEKYIAIWNDDIIELEMSKREKKKWQKNKSK